MKRRILSFLLLLCMIVTLLPASLVFAAANSGTPKLVISTENAKAGETVTLSVSTENNPGVGVLTLELIYDNTKLEFAGFEDGAFKGWKVVTSAVWIGSDDSSYNGEILKLKFKVLDNAADGLAKVSLKCEEGDAYNFSEEEIPFEVVSGGVNVTPTHTHSYTAAVTQPTCTAQGYTTYTCSCGDSYVDSYTKALGHNYVNGACTRCGEKDPDYKPPVQENPFVDVKESSVYYDAILWAYYHTPEQITGGFDATHFVPNNPCTRAQVVTFLWRAAGCPAPASTNNPFVDVSAKQANGKDNPYYTAILWAAGEGITNGSDATHFSPNATVTRAQFVTFLWRYENEPASTGNIDIFADANQIATPFRQAVAWAVERGITNGTDATHFSPKAVCTRWAVVLFMYRDMA